MKNITLMALATSFLLLAGCTHKSMTTEQTVTTSSTETVTHHDYKGEVSEAK